MRDLITGCQDPDLHEILPSPVTRPVGCVDDLLINRHTATTLLAPTNYGRRRHATMYMGVNSQKVWPPLPLGTGFLTVRTIVARHEALTLRTLTLRHLLLLLLLSLQHSLRIYAFVKRMELVGSGWSGWTGTQRCIACYYTCAATRPSWHSITKA